MIFSNFFGKRIKGAELESLRELQRLVINEKIKLSEAAKNTAMIHHGQEYVKTQQGVVQLLEAQLLAHMGTVLGRLGLPQGKRASVNLKTGNVTLIENYEPATDQKNS